MSDFPEHRPALTGKTTVRGEDVQLEASPEGHLLHVSGAVDAAFLAQVLAQCGFPASSIRAAGFRQWFIAGDERVASSEVKEFARILQGRAFVSDQSHGRVRIGLSGARAAEVLAKGTAIDTDSDAFAEGHAAMTLFGHVSVQIARTGHDRFEFTVLRSFAESLWEELERSL
ncbi:MULTISPECIES: sarcosine oxidase subunit gamma [unclassified Sinorhizobium]|uniref:sarcosine oxidase subunit gamma n=1 Tax=unclassified Sinorhizobium TaxID=2613772 RepID=UPI0035246231